MAELAMNETKWGLICGIAVDFRFTYVNTRVLPMNVIAYPHVSGCQCNHAGTLAGISDCHKVS